VLWDDFIKCSFSNYLLLAKYPPQDSLLLADQKDWYKIIFHLQLQARTEAHSLQRNVSVKQKRSDSEMTDSDRKLIPTSRNLILSHVLEYYWHLSLDFLDGQYDMNKQWWICYGTCLLEHWNDVQKHITDSFTIAGNNQQTTKIHSALHIKYQQQQWR